MKKARNSFYSSICLSCLYIGLASTTYGMGLRSFVALPIEKNGTIFRLVFEHASDTDTNFLSTSAAYGISAKQSLLLGLPYQLSSDGANHYGDISVLYRHIVWQRDRLSGTSRLGLLGGVIIPTNNERDATVQAGFVYTHFKNRNEIDVDALYQAGINNRVASGRYDVSWQYRLSPNERPDWGIIPELNSVLELNGRWTEGGNITHQITAGLQWAHQKLVIEGGIVKDINNENPLRYMLSARFHF